MSEKFSKERSVREACAVVCGPREWGDTRESWLARGARRAGVTFRQFRGAFYGEIKDPEHKTLRRIEAAARQRNIEEVARADAKVAVERLVALRAALATIDTEFHGSTIAQIDDALRAMGAEVRAVAVHQTG